MAKTKKRKNKNKDFQKVKLKVGRKIKPSNETLPQIRVGNIQIKSRYAPGTDNSKSAAKPKIENLLKDCVHKKAVTRLTALQKLRELFASFPNEYPLLEHQFEVLDTIPNLFTDGDAAVRGEARKILHCVFSADFAKDFAAGDHHLLLPCLSLAMNHSTEDVKIDSLHLLDVFLQSPKMIADGAAPILKDFLMLISRQRRLQLENGLRPGASSRDQNVRSLLTNPDSRLSQQKWRASVLERLNTFLGILADRVSAGFTSEDWRDGSYTRYVFEEAIDLNSLLKNSEKIQSCVNNLIPLLFECWVETGFLRSGPEQSLNALSISILLNVLKVTRSLVRLMSHSKSNAWFLVNFEEKILQHFVSNFPLCITRKASKRTEKVQDVSLSFNLLVCHIASGMISVTDYKRIDRVPDWLKKIIMFLINVFELPQPILTKAVQETISNVAKFLNNVKEPEHELYESLVAACLRKFLASGDGEVPKNDRERNWFDFCSNSFSPHGNHARLECVQDWYSTLPSLFLELGRGGHEDTEKVVDLLCFCMMQNGLQSMRRDGVSCRQKFTDNLHLYLDSTFLSKLKENKDCLNRFAIAIGWSALFQLQHLTLLARAALSGVIEPFCFSIFCRGLKNRFSNLEHHPGFVVVDFEEYKMMLMNIVMAGFRKDFEILNEMRSVDEWLHVVCDQPDLNQFANRWQKHKELNDEVYAVFELMPYEKKVNQFDDYLKQVVDFVKTQLETFRTVSVLTACSLGLTLGKAKYIADKWKRKQYAIDITEFLKEPATDLLLGLVQCIPTDTDRTLAELVQICPPLSVIVFLLEQCPVLCDALMVRVERIVEDYPAKHAENVINQILVVLNCIIKNDSYFKDKKQTNEAIDRLIQQHRTKFNNPNS